MLTAGRNKDAETAYAMAAKLLGEITPEKAERIWKECHENKELQRLVSIYVYSTPNYAPKALHAVHTKLINLFGER